MSNSVTTLLTQLLADTYTLALKTQNYHWNVVGSDFYGLHTLFESHYQSLYEAADELAERLRVLGDYAPGSFSEFSKLTTIPEAKKGISANDMLVDLVESHKKVAAVAKKLVLASQENKDDATADMAVDRVEPHEKMIWILKSSLPR